MGSGRAEFLFVAPEQFSNPDTLEALLARPPSLFVVDEAHCISAWGHDFRTDYLHLAPVIEQLGRPPVLALTATATPPVREEIVERLAMRSPRVVVQGFDRPNIHLAVERFHDESAQEEALVERVGTTGGPGIVYVATRAGAESLAERLGERARAYHGGLSGGERSEVQDRFMGGDLEVVVATTAFGMGVDKADVRFVFHRQPSDSLDSNYQEIGRAGRDGGAARAVLFYRSEDVGLRRFFASGAQVEEEELAEVVEAVRRAGGRCSVAALEEETGMAAGRLATALGWLDRAGSLEVEAGGAHVRSVAGADAADAAQDASEAAGARRRLDRSRVEMVRGYAESRGCRRRFLLGYFGEGYEPPCGACDNCDRGAAGGADGAAALAYEVGRRVIHTVLGEGTVMGRDDATVVVLFDDGGYKTLLADHVVEQGLLRESGR